jgi:hypothetical protein
MSRELLATELFSLVYITPTVLLFSSRGKQKILGVVEAQLLKNRQRVFRG